MTANIFLRFPDRSTALELATQIEEVSIPGDSRLRFADHWGAIDVVGEVWDGGEWDEMGNEIVAPTLVPGWHVNVAPNPGHVLPVALESYVVHPETPYRVFG
jgi:hypothetical protein